MHPLLKCKNVDWTHSDIRQVLNNQYVHYAAIAACVVNKIHVALHHA